MKNKIFLLTALFIFATIVSAPRVFALPITSVILEGVESSGHVTLSSTDISNITTSLSGHGLTGGIYWYGAYDTNYPIVATDNITRPNDWVWSGGYNGLFSNLSSVDINLADIPSGGGNLGHDLYMCMWIFSPSQSPYYFYAIGSPDYCFHFSWSSGGYHLVSGAPFNIDTRFISVTPLRNQIVQSTGSTTIASSTVHFYINSSDYKSGMTIRASLVTNLGLNMNPGYTSQVYNLFDKGRVLNYEVFPTVGDNTISTTTLPIPFTEYGASRITYTVVKPAGCVFGYCFWSSTLMSTSTVFGFGTTTLADLILAQSNGTWAGVLSSTGTTTVDVISSCNPLSSSFTIVVCLSSLIVPSSEVLEADFKDFQKIPPWGYAFRFYDILKLSSTTTMPSISYTFGTTSPLLASIGTITFDPFGTLTQAGSIVNTKSDQFSQKTLWDIMEPIIYIIVYLMLFFMILHDLTGILKHNKKL